MACRSLWGYESIWTYMDVYKGISHICWYMEAPTLPSGSCALLIKAPPPTTDQCRSSGHVFEFKYGAAS